MSAWIEIQDFEMTSVQDRVALLVSAWIEILGGNNVASMRVIVALLVSAWIEISLTAEAASEDAVALLVSAWIEILHSHP